MSNPHEWHIALCALCLAAALLSCETPLHSSAAAATTTKRTVVRTTQFILPPVEFDKPYEGLVYTQRLDTEEKIAMVCPAGGKIGGEIRHLGCSKKKSVTNDQLIACVIYLASDELLKSYKIDPMIAWRHELGHCNGWPGDHPNMRAVGEQK